MRPIGCAASRGAAVRATASLFAAGLLVAHAATATDATSSAPTAAKAASGRAAASAASSLTALDLIELQIAYTTLLARYYEPIDPRVLVDGARAGIAAELHARAAGSATLPVTPARVSAGDGGDLVDALVLRAIARYGRRVDGHRLAVAAVEGELAALHDPYTVVFRPPAFKKFNAYLGNETYGGIGAVLSFDAATGLAPIERVLAGGPASAAGLRAGDALATIDGKPVARLGAAGLRDALRGKAGTAVSVEAVRGGERRTYALVRAVLRDPEVTSQRFGDTGYVALSRFGTRAGAELRAATNDLRAAGATAFVLDLRGNGGGYGDEATAVASVFLRGTVFTTRERTGAPVVARADGTSDFHAPLAVLVDGDTASAAEIVAGAVQDDRAGTIVGVRTFGKGLVQSVFPLPDGSALKITTARYTTPAGRDIDRVGIVPDVLVTEPAGAVRGDPATDPQLARALEVVRQAAAPADAPASQAPSP